MITSDLHVHPHRICSRNGGKDRLADGLNVVRQQLTHARQRKCWWVSLGDIKQLHGMWPQDALSGLLALFDEYGDVTKILLSGNGGHDGMGSKETGADGYDAFRQLCSVVDTPHVDERPLAWWPWQPQRTAAPLLASLLADAAQLKARVLFGHALLTGAKVGPKEIKLQAGYALSDFALVGARSQRAFDFAFFGDVHKQQVLGDPRRISAAAVVYPGSPYAQNWGELETDKGCVYVDLFASTVERIPLRAPRFRILDLRAHGLPSTGYEDDFVRVLLPRRLTTDALDELRARLKCRVLEPAIVPRAETSTAAGARRSLAHAAMRDVDLLDEYLRVVPPPDGVSVDGVRAAGRALLEGK